MMNSNLSGFHIHTVDNGYTLAIFIDEVIARAKAKSIKFLIYLLLITVGVAVSPFAYIFSLYILRDVRNKVNSIKPEIPNMSLDDLLELQTQINLVINKHDFTSFKNALNSGSIFSMPIKKGIFQLICAMQEVSEMAKKQQEADLEIMANGWEQEIPMGIIPHEIDLSDW